MAFLKLLVALFDVCHVYVCVSACAWCVFVCVVGGSAWHAEASCGKSLFAASDCLKVHGSPAACVSQIVAFDRCMEDV